MKKSSLFGTSAARSRLTFWLLLLLFAVIYLLFRLPWIACDPGVPSVWEYGYNATDEGYYLSGGKERLVWGYFVDLPRNEAFTYGFSAGTHWLSYLAHLLFGLSTWTWRIPFTLIYLAAWLAMYCHVAKRTGAALAFALCTSISLTPLVIAYERTASNDTLIGALLVLSYVIAAGGKRWRVLCAGVLAGAVVLVKPSVWVLLPIVAAGVADERELRACIKDLALFLGVAIASVFAWKLVVALSVLPDARRAGVGMWEIVRKTTTHYPLPSIFDFTSHFKGISSYPRDPSIQILSVSAPLILSIPFAMAARNALTKKLNGHFLLFLALPAYIAAVSVMNTIYTHYFIPVVMMLPIVFSAIVQDLSQAEDNRMPWRSAVLMLVLVLALCALGIIGLASYSMPPAISQNYFSKIYNHPRNIVWGGTWPMLGVFSLLVMAVWAATQRFRVSTWQIALFAIVSLVAASVVFAPLPAVQLAPYMKKSASEYFMPLALSLVASSVLLPAIFDLKGRLPGRWIATCALPLCVLASYLATPTWRTAFGELVRPGTHRHAEMAKELRTLLPEDAIVIGERSNQMLMSLPIRSATTFSANSDPIPIIKSILEAEPNAKLYALADSQHAYNLQHYREHANEYRLRPVKTFKMPSFSTGAPADVFLCEILVAKKH